MQMLRRLVMIPEEMFSDELLRQAAEKCAEAIFASLPAPEECNHKFSKRFEEKMQLLIKGIGTTCCTIVIQDSVIRKIN